ncbi:expressed unknown protein [Seminavis robusta]|uniref:Uncharacterized protein n=1 Tax=Seminavis robusta TaxID=568900 RepID=A0A9N8H3R5_9STRA|nr:expressed unknown protein [Seminavis robusta]|eukprot:Sro44_g026700.1 n/a (1226) ;mRNA; r:121042-126032
MGPVAADDGMEGSSSEVPSSNKADQELEQVVQKLIALKDTASTDLEDKKDMPHKITSLVQELDTVESAMELIEARDDIPEYFTELLAKAKTNLATIRKISTDVAEDLTTTTTGIGGPREQQKRNLAAAKDEKAKAQDETSNQEDKNDGHHHNPHVHTQRKLQSSRRHNRLLKAQDALWSGDMAYFEKKASSSSSAAPGGDRRLASMELDEQGRQLQAAAAFQDPHQDCLSMFQCLQSWTTYDVLAFFLADDINDAGNITSKRNNFDADNLDQKIADIRATLALFDRTDFLATPELGPKCNMLLSSFHRNTPHGDYSTHIQATWTDVCRAEGSNTYIKLSEISAKVGPSYADTVFQDLVACTTKLDHGSHAHSFFGWNSDIRFPKAINHNAIDKHGKLHFGLDLYEYKYKYAIFGHAEMKKYNQAGAVTAGPPHWDVWNTISGCREGVNGFYKDWITTKTSPYLFDDHFINGGRRFPTLLFKCDNSWDCFIANGENGHVICRGTVTPKTINGDVKCPATGYGGGVGSEAWYDVPVLEAPDDDKMLAAELVLGAKTSNGLVCAHKDVSMIVGYCCLDGIGESSGDTLWGQSFDCNMGKSACNALAPALAGMSQATCDLYSGTFCYKPRDCAPLVQCITDEIQWANTTDPVKASYRDFLLDSPILDIKDTTDNEECGGIREYFGFESHWPNDQEICEDVKFLRHSKTFTDLDGSNADFSTEMPTSAPLPTSPPAPTIAPLPPLNEPVVPSVSAAYVDQYARNIYQFEMGLLISEELYNLGSSFECPEDLTGAVKTGCAIGKNIAVVILAVILWTASRILEYMVYADPTPLGEFEKHEIYENVMTLYDNMVLLQEGFEVIGGQNSAIQDAANLQHESTREILKGLIEENKRKIDGPDGIRHQIMVDAKTKYEALYSHITDTCTPVRRRFLLEDDSCESTDPPKLMVPAHPDIPGRNGAFQVTTPTFSSVSEAVTFLNETLRVESTASGLEHLELAVSGEQECSVEVDATPVVARNCGNKAKNHTGPVTSFALLLDSKPPTLSCDFLDTASSPSHLFVSGDKKTLFVEEGSGPKVNTGLRVTVEDSCSDHLTVTLSVESNEFDEKTSVVMAKSRSSQKNTGGPFIESPKLFVSPTTCGATAEDRLCISGAATTMRFYKAVVTVTDKAGWTTTDTCNIFVVPPKTDGTATTRELLRASSQAVMTMAEAKDLVGKTDELFMVGNLDLDWTRK